MEPMGWGVRDDGGRKKGFVRTEEEETLLPGRGRAATCSTLSHVTQLLFLLISYFSLRLNYNWIDVLTSNLSTWSFLKKNI